MDPSIVTCSNFNNEIRIRCKGFSWQNDSRIRRKNHTVPLIRGLTYRVVHNERCFIMNYFDESTKMKELRFSIIWRLIVVSHRIQAWFGFSCKLTGRQLWINVPRSFTYPLSPQNEHDNWEFLFPSMTLRVLWISITFFSFVWSDTFRPSLSCCAVSRFHKWCSWMISEVNESQVSFSALLVRKAAVMWAKALQYLNLASISTDLCVSGSLVLIRIASNIAYIWGNSFKYWVIAREVLVNILLHNDVRRFTWDIFLVDANLSFKISTYSMDVHTQGDTIKMERHQGHTWQYHTPSFQWLDHNLLWQAHRNILYF